MSHTKQTVEHYKAKLQEQKRLLEQSLLSAVEQGREAAAEDTQDAVDLAVSSYQKEMLFSQGTHGHAVLTMVRDALERVDDGSYGECTLCSQAIGTARLEALPWTPVCIACQEKIENGEIEDAGRAA